MYRKPNQCMVLQSTAGAGAVPSGFGAGDAVVGLMGEESCAGVELSAPPAEPQLQPRKALC